MIRLKRLFTDPALFDPILFTSGVNLILGERVPDSEVTSRKDRKTNGVGKSMCIEFIGFCLLKDKDSSRVMKMPLGDFDRSTKVGLEMVIGEKEVTIVRTLDNPDKPFVRIDGRDIPFKGLEDARKYLENLIYGLDGNENPRPTFREILGPLVRDESSEFKDILNSHDLLTKVPHSNLLKAHLYFFGIDIDLVKNIQELLKKLDDQKDTMSYVKKRLFHKGEKIDDVQAEVTAMEFDLEQISHALNRLQTEPSLNLSQQDIVDLDSQIHNLRTKRMALRLELKRIEQLPKAESVDPQEIGLIYEKFRSGLGDMVAKSLEEVIVFKNKIETYQRLIFDKRKGDLENEVSSISNLLHDLDAERARIVTSSVSMNAIEDIKMSFHLYDQKKEEHARRLSALEEFKTVEMELKRLKIQRDSLFGELNELIFAKETVVRNFNITLAAIHQYIMGSAEVSFSINVIDKPNSKQVVTFTFRIPDDGSHSVNRTKVFVYDMALMFNSFTRELHPKFLIHDNIFDVDQDTLVQSLNYLSERELDTDFQYILTLNRDKIETEEKEGRLALDIESHTRASFTHAKKFLGINYKELD